MTKYIYAVVAILIMSCNQNSSKEEKDYIKNLEEKNRILEKELSEIKRTGTSGDTSQHQGQKANKSLGYFTIGSTEDEVINVMGEPTTYLITATEAKKFLYGLSTVYFYKNKVISYDNLEGNLKVKIKR